MKRLVLLVALLAPIRSASAHAFDPMLVEVHEDAAGRIDVRMHAPPSLAGSAEFVAPTLALVPDGGSGLRGRAITLSGLDGAHEAVLRVTLRDGTELTSILHGDADRFDIPRVAAARPRASVFRGYLGLGVLHIFTGFDHLLFLLALVLLVPAPRRLLAAATAFTLAHSLTLALATLGALSLPQAPVEALIALSIVFLAVELADPRSDGLTRRRPAVTAFAFGLVHGLGFAGVFAGHHEYWSAGMRDNLEAYNHAGGNTVFLSGNTCWFQVRFDYVDNQMICYKVAEFDPLVSSSAARFTTTNWHLPPVNDPSPRTTGLMWSSHLTPPLSAPGVPLYEFTVVPGQESHWVYEGLQGLGSFGAYVDAYARAQDSIANGAELDCTGGSCFLGGHDGGPRVTSLAEVLMDCGGGKAGVATMCLFRPTPTSYAFNAGTYKWCRALSTGSGWTAMDQITRNVLDRFLAT